MGRRSLLLIAAVFVAALGTFAVFLYADNANDRALAKQDPVEVLVAKAIIPAGTLASEAERQGNFRRETLPRLAVVEGALRDIAQISTLVAISDIYPGEQILAAKFGAVGSAGALPIPSGKMAMSVQVGDPQRVAGFVQPGSEVALFVTIKWEKVPGQKDAEVPPEFTRLLLPRVQVIAVGPTTLRRPTDGETANKEAVPTAIMTLAVDQSQAQRLVFAATKANLYFALLAKDSKVGPAGAVDIRNLFS